MLKTKPYNACAITCFASHIFQSRYLNQLLTNRLHYGILQFTGRRIGYCHLHCNFGYRYVGQQRNRQGEVCYQTEYKAGCKRHQYCNRALY